MLNKGHPVSHGLLPALVAVKGFLRRERKDVVVDLTNVQFYA